MTAADGNLQEAIDACVKVLEHDSKDTSALHRLTELTGDKWGATSVQSWKHCPLITQAKRICKHIGEVDITHQTSFTSSYNTNHGAAEVSSCTREFFQNLYDHVQQRNAEPMRRSLLMRRETDSRSQQDQLLEEVAYTLNVASGNQPQELEDEIARVQITPANQGRRALVCFAQKWDGALDSSHLLLHSQKTAAQGNAGGVGEGFKVAANNLLSRFSTPQSEPCTIVMVMNGRTWRFVYRNYQGSEIRQLVVEEYETEVYGGLVVFIDVPISSFCLDRIWNPFHYVPTMPLTTWTPLLPPGLATATSYVNFLEIVHLPSRVFRQGIYVGKIPGSTGIYFNEGGTISIGRDRADTGSALLQLTGLIEQRVKVLPVGFKDYVVMERLMNNPTVLGLLPWTIPSKQVYDSFESYIRRRDRVPDSWRIFLVDPRRTTEVCGHLRVEGVQATVHVVGSKAPLWTYHSQVDLENAIMIEMFTQLSDGDKQVLEVEKRILALISTESWVFGVWPGNLFKRFAGDSKRYVDDTKSRRKLVEATLFNDEGFFMGLCLDAWAGAGLDHTILAKAIGADRHVLHDSNKMRNLVSCARQLLTAKEGRGLLKGPEPATIQLGQLTATDQGHTVEGHHASPTDNTDEAGAAPNSKSGGSPVKKPIRRTKSEKTVRFA